MFTAIASAIAKMFSKEKNTSQWEEQDLRRAGQTQIREVRRERRTSRSAGSHSLASTIADTSNIGYSTLIQNADIQQSTDQWQCGGGCDSSF